MQATGEFKTAMLVKRRINDDARIRRYLEYRDFEDFEDSDSDDDEEEEENDDDHHHHHNNDDNNDNDNNNNNNLLTTTMMRIIQHCTQFLYSHMADKDGIRIAFMSGR